MKTCYEFAYSQHNDHDGLPCHWSLRVIPHDVQVHSWGNGHDTATCLGCSKSVRLLDVEVPITVQSGDLIAVNGGAA